MRHFARYSPTVLKVKNSVDDFVEVEKFNIPDDFKIEGCYINAMGSLMEFAETQNAEQSLKKLKEFRASIAKDVDLYYESHGQVKER